MKASKDHGICPPRYEMKILEKFENIQKRILNWRPKIPKCLFEYSIEGKLKNGGGSWSPYFWFQCTLETLEPKTFELTHLSIRRSNVPKLNIRVRFEINREISGAYLKENVGCIYQQSHNWPFFNQKQYVRNKMCLFNCWVWKYYRCLFW